MAYVEIHCRLLVEICGTGQMGSLMLILSLRMCSDRPDPSVFELVKARV